MSNIFKGLVGAFMAMALLVTPAAAWQSVDFTNAAFAPVTGPTSIPVGAAEFCKTYRGECGVTGSVMEAQTLTGEAWSLLIAVNDHVNLSVTAITDAELYGRDEVWTYPQGSGDCEDFALEKRRLLIANGWDSSTLMMTVVRQANGAGHAVLMVRTDRGDLVLDNQDGRILLWNETPYMFVKRQSQADLGTWVGIDDTRPILASAQR